MSLHIRFMGFLHTMETTEALSQIYEMLAAFFLHAAHTERAVTRDFLLSIVSVNVVGVKE